ncbi:methyltransferase [Actinopolymorpha sp. B11F2]|uniref:class I SAM-dependent methyltransferase n=1 Tax=Actinopolymorpha sp. B11F2 TaxID=3160862 RepID=UPI0032E45787
MLWNKWDKSANLDGAPMDKESRSGKNNPRRWYPKLRSPALSRVRSFNNYAKQLSDDEIEAGLHRKRVGAYWQEVGKLQFDFLVSQGLQPDHRLLDVGCGALRGGLHFIRYLEPGHYYGIDLNQSLLKAGIEHEVPRAGLTDRMPATNLRQTDMFACDDFGVTFDFMLSVSVFSHLPLNHLRLCLHQLAKVTKPGASYFTTFFEAADALPLDERQRRPDRKGWTYSHRDPFHYTQADLEWVAGVGPWKFVYVGDWSHRRGQKMAQFIRTD